MPLKVKSMPKSGKKTRGCTLEDLLEHLGCGANPKARKYAFGTAFQDRHRVSLFIMSRQKLSGVVSDNQKGVKVYLKQYGKRAAEETTVVHTMRVAPNLEATTKRKKTEEEDIAHGHSPSLSWL
ncbi:hypothetical protein FBEOM_8818 [Fusarium beomiforme]|uniref:Uncharacterized protein n=1 Tax=Fusarium beomiforme TaxID=44412 RepID=A0A9P5AED6_9HYPO|nr:hypothetical protein FBEOM_8818 [Fusarium beomiforme]